MFLQFLKERETKKLEERKREVNCVAVCGLGGYFKFLIFYHFFLFLVSLLTWRTGPLGPLLQLLNWANCVFGFEFSLDLIFVDLIFVDFVFNVEFVCNCVFRLIPD